VFFLLMARITRERVSGVIEERLAVDRKVMVMSRFGYGQLGGEARGNAKYGHFLLRLLAPLRPQVPTMRRNHGHARQPSPPWLPPHPSRSTEAPRSTGELFLLWLGFDRIEYVIEYVYVR
jgi:hypothetical protein